MISSFRSVALVLLLTAASCQSTAPSNLAALADGEPTPYSVLVTGGAFLDPVPRQQALESTYAAADPATSTDAVEVLPLGTFLRALRIARVFHRIEVDHNAVQQRLALTERIGGTAAAQSIATAAAAAGHDYLLLIERLVDGPVREYGINGRWPVTAVAWVVLGIGMVIPDHTFESSATLHVSLRDVHSGQIVYSRVFDGDPVDLALIDRTDVLGLIVSILVPPFWVGNDEERVRKQVREATTQRLLFLLAQDLKSVACRDELASRAPAKIAVTLERDGIRVRISALEGVASIRTRLDGERGVEPQWQALERRLLDSATFVDGRTEYDATWPRPSGRFLQVLVQTVGGRVASTTIDLRPRGAG